MPAPRVEYARCQECKEIVELELRRDHENHAEWCNESHFRTTPGPHLGDGACPGSGVANWSVLTEAERAAHLKEGVDG